MTWHSGHKQPSRHSSLWQGVSAGLLGSGLGWAVLTLGLSSWNGLQMVMMTNGPESTTGWSPAWLLSSGNVGAPKPNTPCGCKGSREGLMSPKDSSSDLLTWVHLSGTRMISSVSE